MVRDEYKDLWQIFKMILVSSHGQATVERGFSVNSAILVENKKEMTYTSQRLVCDYVAKMGGSSK